MGEGGQCEVLKSCVSVTSFVQRWWVNHFLHESGSMKPVVPTPGFTLELPCKLLVEWSGGGQASAIFKSPPGEPVLQLEWGPQLNSSQTSAAPEITCGTT